MARPIESSNDIRSFEPRETSTEPGAAPRKDALYEALTAICVEWEAESERAANQSDVGQAEDQFLSGLAEDRSASRQEGESNAVLRSRAVSAPTAVSRPAIAAVVNEILAAYTPAQCRVFESIRDRAYIPGPTNTAFHTYVGAPPSYPDRQYDQRPNAAPPGAWVFGNRVGRCIVVVIPELASAAETQTAFSAVANAVSKRVGGGIRWVMWAKPGLV